MEKMSDLVENVSSFVYSLTIGMGKTTRGEMWLCLYSYSFKDCFLLIVQRMHNCKLVQILAAPSVLCYETRIGPYETSLLKYWGDGQYILSCSSCFWLLMLARFSEDLPVLVTLLLEKFWQILHVLYSLTLYSSNVS